MEGGRGNWGGYCQGEGKGLRLWMEIWRCTAWVVWFMLKDLVRCIALGKFEELLATPQF